MTVVDAQSRVAYWAAAYGVPPQIALAVAQRESGFNQNAIGKKGEAGIFQFMAPTAAAMRVDPYNPESNIEGGVRLLRDEYAYFGRWDYTLAAFNAGRSRAAQGPDKWPDSTRQYVSQIMSAAGQPVDYSSFSDSGAITTSGTTGEWGQPDDSSIGADVLAGDTITMVALVGVAILLFLYFTD